MKRRQHNAFTLIELLLVMVILTVLAAIVVPKLTGRTEQARQAAAKADIHNIESALNAFEIDNGRFPTADEGLGAMVTQPSQLANWHGPYIEHGVPVDPWGNAYVYRFPGSHNANGFDLFSMGPDGREGTDDITNWQQ